MSNLIAGRRLREERWTHKQFALAAIAVFQGGAAVIDTSIGFVTKAKSSNSLQAIGLFDEDVDNSAGANGDLLVNVKLARELAIIRFANGTAADAIASTDIGKACYFIDDNTVSIVPTGNALAGIIWDVNATKGVAVELMPSVRLGMQAHAAIAFAANDIAIATPGRNQHYIIPATAAASTVSLGNTGAVRGDENVFTADGVLNAHTVQYRDGATAITAALTAAKRHQVRVVFDGTLWSAVSGVSP